MGVAETPHQVGKNRVLLPQIGWKPANPREARIQRTKDLRFGVGIAHSLDGIVYLAKICPPVLKKGGLL